jgi:hypothetical protein
VRNRLKTCLLRSRLLLTLTLALPLAAGAQGMPDLREMSGVPLPVSDVPSGTVTVRVIRGTLANNITGQLVELAVDGVARQASTNESGRAEFSGLRPGARVTASADVNGERLASQEFAVPPAGGVRVLLVATDPEAAAPAGEDRPAAGTSPQGTLVASEQSRFVFELGDDGLNVFNILQIVNTAGAPVDAKEPLVFEAAPNGGTVTVLNGSSPRATADGRRVVVAGPFPPGPTLVQFAYTVPYAGPDATIEQRMPIALNQVTVLAQKAGDMRLASPQVRQQREMSAQGDTYIVGQGPAIAGGGVVSFSFEGLPHAPVWPRNVALGLAAAILTAGVWAGVRGRDASLAQDRKRLEADKERLFTELAAIERRQRSGRADDGDATRRRELVSELEGVYAALDPGASA